MISSTNSTDRAARLAITPDLLPRNREQTQVSTGDQLSTGSAQILRAALEQQPAVRPAEVQRARELANDGSYPPEKILSKVAATILSAPDLSEDHS